MLANYGPWANLDHSLFLKFIGTQAHPFVYVLFMASLCYQKQRWPTYGPQSLWLVP